MLPQLSQRQQLKPALSQKRRQSTARPRQPRLSRPHRPSLKLLLKLLPTLCLRLLKSCKQWPSHQLLKLRKLLKLHQRLKPRLHPQSLLKSA